MYGTTSVNSLPVTGVGAAAGAAAMSGEPLGALIVALAVWTVAMAVRTAGRMLPKREV